MFRPPRPFRPHRRSPGRRGTRLALLAVAVAFATGCGGAVDEDEDRPAAPVITAPAALADGLGGSVVLAATPGDDAGVAGIEFQVDGMALGPVDTAAPYEATLDTATQPAGQHVLRARARNADGRTSAWASVTVRIGGTTGVAQGFSKNDTWVGGLTDATAIAAAPDGRFFVAEQGGRLRVVKNGGLLAAPFVQLDVDATGERGLIGVALHPDFARNGVVYVHYTTRQGGTHNRVSFFVADAARGGDVATGVETVLLELPPLSSATNHNGGGLHFGADGRLYIGVGDNANGAQARDPANPKGKLLRLNADGSVPPDNPFAAGASGFQRAVWAIGLRNPYTFAVQPGTGRIHINDVGADRWEEINLGEAGADYGWPDAEGPDGVRGGITGPLFAYGHRAADPPGSGPGGFFTGSAISGGAFYPDDGNFPAAMRGNYFFADFGSRFVARMDLANDNAVYAFASVPGMPVDLCVGTDGALVVLMRDAIARIARN